MDINIIKWIYAKSRKTVSKQVILIIGNSLVAINALVFSIVCKNIIDSATKNDKIGLIDSAVEILLIIVIHTFLKYFNSQLEENIRGIMGVLLRKQVIADLYRKEFRCIEGFHSGELVNRIFSDVDIVTEGVIGIIPVATNLIVRIFGAVIILILLGQSTVLLFIALALLVILSAKILKQKYKYLHKNVQEKEGKMRSFIQEEIENLLLVKSFNIEEKIEKKTDKYQDEYFEAQMKKRTLTNAVNSGSSFFLQLGYIMTLIWCATGILMNRVGMSYGMITAVLQLVGQIQNPFISLSGLLPKTFSMIASAERLIELEDLPNESNEKIDKMNPVEFQKLECKDISFGYTNEHKVLKHVSLSVNQGDVVSLQGISGQGKSTLFLLLLGIYQPNSGNICILDNKSTYKPGKSARSVFAWVPQGKFVFSGTIRENVTLLNDLATELEIRRAIEISCADTFIDKLPNRLDTYIGERGIGLSEGQIQRIAIARALLSKAAVLLLDESTSALDIETEMKLLSNLQKIEKKTCFIVTHRRTALEICNRHYVLEKGVIKEHAG